MRRIKELLRYASLAPIATELPKIDGVSDSDVIDLLIVLDSKGILYCSLFDASLHFLPAETVSNKGFLKLTWKGIELQKALDNPRVQKQMADRFGSLPEIANAIDECIRLNIVS